MKKVIVAMLGGGLILGEVNAMKRSMAPVPADRQAVDVANRPVEEYYGGNPKTETASLYVYLCRRGGNPMEKNCKCRSCTGDRAGLSLGFICVDDGMNDFVEVGPNTSNILWSMHVRFSGSGNCCQSRPGDLSARYYYKELTYSQIEELSDGSVFRNSEFLHNERGRPCEKRDLRGIFTHLDGTLELSISGILRTSLFRFKIPGDNMPTVSGVLHWLGRLGEKKQIGNQGSHRVHAPYHILGLKGNNCATFCRSALGGLACFPIIKNHLNSGAITAEFLVPTVTLAAAGGFGAEAAVSAGVLTEMVLAGTTIGTGAFPLIGSLVGGGIGVVVGGVLFVVTIAKKANANMPEAVVDQFLDFFQESYEKGNEAIREFIDEYFSIVVHNEEEVKRYLRPQGIRFDPSYKFGLRKISDVMRTNVRMKKAKGTIFLEKDFEVKSDSGCILL